MDRPHARTSGLLVLLLLLGAASAFLLPQSQPLRARSIRPTPAALQQQQWRRGLRPTPTMAGAGGAEAGWDQETDVVVIGSGIGGLSCAALCAYYGLDVRVYESHYHAGGCAHSFEVGGFHFDSGPSLWNGMDGKKGKRNPYVGCHHHL